jgi:hypothetical protein
MSYFYIPNPVNKTDYIGNSLSAFNQSFSALDTGLYELSSYVIEEITNINTSIDVISANFDNYIPFDDNGYISPEFIPIPPTPIYYIGNISDTIILDRENGGLQIINLTGDATFAEPLNGVIGSQLKMYVSAEGNDRDISFDNSIVVPSEASFTSPKTLTEDNMYIIQLECDGNVWMLTTLIGGYSSL